MLLRSGKSLNFPLDFRTCSLQQSVFIESGGLWFRSNFQQVSKYSYSSLAKLNSFGFITVDSVDHHYVSKEMGGIHCTATGFVLSETWKRLQPIVYQQTSRIAIIQNIIVDEWVEEYNQHIHLPVNYYKNEENKCNQSFIRLYYTRKAVDNLKQQIHLDTKEPVELITFIDMQNNINPNHDNGMFVQLIHAFSLCPTI